MTIDEHETVIVYDYAKEKVSFYTTRVGEKRNFIARIGGDHCKVQEHWSTSEERAVAWTIVAPMKRCRNPYMVSSIND